MPLLYGILLLWLTSETWKSIKKTYKADFFLEELVIWPKTSTSKFTNFVILLYWNGSYYNLQNLTWSGFIGQK